MRSRFFLYLYRWSAELRQPGDDGELDDDAADKRSRRLRTIL